MDVIYFKYITICSPLHFNCTPFSSLNIRTEHVNISSLMTDWCQCIKNSMDPTTISTWFPLYNLEYLHTEANTKTKLRFEFCITDSKYHILLSQLTKFPRSPFHESSWYPVKRRQHWFKLECVFVCIPYVPYAYACMSRFEDSRRWESTRRIFWGSDVSNEKFEEP